MNQLARDWHKSACGDTSKSMLSSNFSNALSVMVPHASHELMLTVMLQSIVKLKGKDESTKVVHTESFATKKHAHSDFFRKVGPAFTGATTQSARAVHGSPQPATHHVVSEVI